LGVRCNVLHLLLQRRNRKFIALKVSFILLGKADGRQGTALGNGKREVVGNGLVRYAAEGRCQAFGLNSVFVGRSYEEILINLRGLALGGNSEGLCFDGYVRSMNCKLQSGVDCI
jgi:hypothetical protein